MNKLRLDFDAVNVESFSIQSPQPALPSPSDPIQPGYETDEGHLSLCYVSCAGSCHCDPY